MADMEKVIVGLEHCDRLGCSMCPYKPGGYSPMDCRIQLMRDALALLKKQEEIVHPEPSCEMTYITDCCCDLCGVQLIREDNFCRCCGKRIEWEGR